MDPDRFMNIPVTLKVFIKILYFSTQNVLC